MGGALFGVSIPVFWLGIMMMMFFCVTLHWFPIGGRLSLMISLNKITGIYLLDSLLTLNFKAFWDALLHLVLPSVALATIPTATIARITRSSMLEVLKQDFIRTERAKGVPEHIVLFKHAAKNSLIPIVTVTGMILGTLLGGAILTETVFAWPGLGRYVVEAINMRDYAAIQGSVLFLSAVFVIINLLTDILYRYIDPRVKLQ